MASPACSSWLRRSAAVEWGKREQPSALAQICQPLHADLDGTVRARCGGGAVFYSWLPHLSWRHFGQLVILHEAACAGRGGRRRDGQCHRGKRQATSVSVPPGGSH